MELDGSGQEGASHLGMEGQHTLDQVGDNLDDHSREVGLVGMLGQNAGVDGSQGILAWEAEGKHTEVALQPRVDGEAASCWVHAADILCVVDVLQGQFDPVIPMAVVQVLADQCVGLYSEVLVHLQAIIVI